MITFLLKGLLRDRSRSLFPMTTVFLGVLLTVFFDCWITGIVGNLIETSAKLGSGHVQIATRGYAKEADQFPNDLALGRVGELMADVRQRYSDLQWTPRIHFGGLLDVPDAHGETRVQGPVVGFAVDLFSPSSPERPILDLQSALVRGKLPNKSNQVLLSDEFASRLKVAPGDTVTLIGSTMFGSLATANFVVAGTVRFGAAALDRGTMIIDLADAQEVLDMADSAGEVIGFFKSGVYHDQSAAAMAGAFNDLHRGDHGLLAPAMDTLRNQSGLGAMLELIEVFVGILVGVFLLAMSVVLWNTGLMGNLRRYGEIGVRLAMGEAKGHVFRSMIGESVLIGLAGSALGTAAGLGLSYWIQVRGIDFSSLFENASILMTARVRTQVTPTAYVIGFIPGLLATLLGSTMAGIGIFKRQTSRLIKELEA